MTWYLIKSPDGEEEQIVSSLDGYDGWASQEIERPPTEFEVVLSDGALFEDTSLKAEVEERRTLAELSRLQFMRLIIRRARLAVIDDLEEAQVIGAAKAQAMRSRVTNSL
jgi:hypothetical protein